MAFLRNQTRFATREDCDAKARFAHFLRENYGLRDKCVPVGFSCGGAHAVNFCGAYPEHPERVADWIVNVCKK